MQDLVSATLRSLEGRSDAKALIALALVAVISVLQVFYPPKVLKPIRAAFPGLGQVSFFSDRTNFWHKHVGVPEHGTYRREAKRFMVRDAVILSAPIKESESVFYNNRSMAIYPAYAKLFAGLPQNLSSTHLFGLEQAEKWFKETLRKAIKSERLNKLCPRFVEDVAQALARLPAWDKGTGTFDSEAFSFPLVFLISNRLTGFDDLSDHAKDIEEMNRRIWVLQKASAYTTVLFPLLPTPATVNKYWNGYKALDILKRYLRARTKDGIYRDDMVQSLIESDAPNERIISFVMETMFSATVNTAAVARWLINYLGASTETRTAVVAEIESKLDALGAKHGPTWSTQTRLQQLHKLELAEWEGVSPTLELALKETLRLLMDITLFRVYPGPAASGAAAAHKPSTAPVPVVGGEPMRAGEHLAYWLGGLHHNADIYANPLRWDVGRWERGEGRGEGDFLAWGTGLRPCSGQRFASLEIKIIAATLAILADWTTVNPETGEAYSLDTIPAFRTSTPDRPALQPLAVKFRRR